MAVPAMSRDGESQDDTSKMASPVSAASTVSQHRRNLSAKSQQDQCNLSSPDAIPNPEEPVQLPSPEETPSPRSCSPPFVTTDTLSADASEVKSYSNGYGRSSSYENFTREREDPGSARILLPQPISKMLPPHELHDIPEEKPRRPRKLSASKSHVEDKILKLSPFEIEELTRAPESLPLPPSSRLTVPDPDAIGAVPEGFLDGKTTGRTIDSDRARALSPRGSRPAITNRGFSTPMISRQDPSWLQKPPNKTLYGSDASTPRNLAPAAAPGPHERRRSESRPEPLELNSGKPSHTKPHSKSNPAPISEPLPSPLAQDLPLPPMSIPTYLQLELASSRPSPLYIHRSSVSEYPYESSRIKFERLLNFLLLPPQLESVLLFGALACLDAWLHTFTILPLRFVKAIIILVQWWAMILAREARFISSFIYHGSGRFVDRQRGRGDSLESTPASRSTSRASQPAMSSTTSYQSPNHADAEHTSNGHAERLRIELQRKPNSTWGRRRRRTKSQPSTLSSYHKADLLQGLVIICSCMLLMMFDASRMYHSIRGQSAVKLYMIWNVLEVADRLLSALGQDILECLFAEETLERGPDGRSKILRPFGMFILALVYNIIHAAALFYQVITLNVAVNSYSNALLSLLMSNMFVEVKSAVFKKFEKDNIFQLTCADVVERFQLWLMLLIIGLRNIVELGGLSMMNNPSSTAEAVRNTTAPLRTGSILPASFTILPNWTGEVLSPFMLVLGCEMVVDWLKHAYISKFNNIKPAVYKKFLDVLAKDYYTNAFVNQNLTKRLGLPVIPLSCLFIRSSLQTYHMFLATHLPPHIPSTATELALEGAQPSPETTAALEHFDALIRRALGRSTFGSGSSFGLGDNQQSWSLFALSTDDFIAFTTMLIFFLCTFLVLLACKLVLGMVLLRYARNRYSSMKEREQLSVDTKGKRVGGWGIVEVDEEKRKWIYEDDVEGAKALRERERKVAAAKAKELEKGGLDFGRVARYEMVAKRIW